MQALCRFKVSLGSAALGLQGLGNRGYLEAQGPSNYLQLGLQACLQLGNIYRAS